MTPVGRYDKHRVLSDLNSTCVPLVSWSSEVRHGLKSRGSPGGFLLMALGENPFLRLFQILGAPAVLG